VVGRSFAHGRLDCQKLPRHPTSGNKRQRDILKRKRRILERFKKNIEKTLAGRPWIRREVAVGGPKRRQGG